MDMRQWVVFVLMVGVVSGGVLNWMGMVDTNRDGEHHKKADNKHHINKDTEHHNKKDNEHKKKKEVITKPKEKDSDDIQDINKHIDISEQVQSHQKVKKPTLEGMEKCQ